MTRPHLEAIKYETAGLAASPDIEPAENQTLPTVRLNLGGDFVELSTNQSPMIDSRQWHCTPVLEVAP